MENLRTQLIKFLSISTLILVGSLLVSGFKFDRGDKSVYPDSVSAELRPFDFSDSYYKLNGVRPELIVGRRSGLDKYSVFDYINSESHRDVRIIGTLPTYDFEGRKHYSVVYGELYESGFADDAIGEEAIQIATEHPIYLFPSTRIPGQFRHAAVIENTPGYFEKNPLGLGLVVLVEFTEMIETKKGAAELEILYELNGTSTDGTPIIRSVEDICDLTRKGLVLQTIRNWKDVGLPSFMMMRVLKTVEHGAISPDAFLTMARDESGSVLEREMIFVNEFRCLQSHGKWCIDTK